MTNDQDLWCGMGFYVVDRLLGASIHMKSILLDTHVHKMKV